MKNTIFVLLASIVLSSCAARVPVIDVNRVQKAELQESNKIRIFTVGDEFDHSKISEYLGEITAYSCKHLLWDPPASKGNALTQLRLLAFDMGADGIIDVTFDTRGEDAWGTNCWESVQASGMAVKFKK